MEEINLRREIPKVLGHYSRKASGVFAEVTIESLIVQMSCK